MSDKDNSKLGSYDEELETGIFNMIVSLCQHKAARMPLDRSKAEVSAWLERIVAGLNDNNTDKSE